ncbi:MAG: HflK protein, partial [Opitutae bacterium]|nr:HflK protein [Opitutae bacterium]
MSQPTEIRIPDFFRGGIIIWVVLIIAVLAGLLTSVYTVPAESQGVVLQFGEYSKTVEPGLRFKLPFGIEQVYVLPVLRQLKQEYGFSTPG